MSSGFYPLGMNSYNNRSNQGGYKSWKGTGVFSNPTGVTAGNIRPLTNNDQTNNAPQKFGLPRPIQHYRKGITVTSLDDSTNSRQVKSSTGGGSLVGQMIDIPGGFSIKENVVNETSNTEELDRDCQTCQGIGIISDWQPITNLTEKPETETQSLQYCCNQERNALRRVRPASTKLKRKYFTTTTDYLYNRCQTFDQKQFNYLSSGTAAAKPGAPLSQNNVYNANCNPNLEIEYAESLLPDAPALTPSNPLGCEKVEYKPSNHKFAQQGAVSSSDRLMRLNVETINTNRADIIKTRENLEKSKYFPNASGNIDKPSCIIGSKQVYSLGTTIMYITYNDTFSPFGARAASANFTLFKNQPITETESLFPPPPIIEGEFIKIFPSYEIIDVENKIIKLSLKYYLYTDDNDILLNLGLSFTNNVDYYNARIQKVDIIQFDGMPLFGVGYQFAGLTSEIIISAPDQPRIISGTSALFAFSGCTNFNSPGIINWNIKNMVNLSSMFENTPLFNQDISIWDTSSVTNMKSMFQNTPLFNQAIGAWDTSSVTDMSSMFQGATAFNNGQVAITTFRTSERELTVTFNQDISIWDTSSVTDMSFMFQGATDFNQDISAWDVSNVTTMESMFYGATSFNNGDLGNNGLNPLDTWNAYNCISFSSMFQNATVFNQSLSNLVDTTNVTSCTMDNMFQNAIAFNPNISAWNTNNVTTMDSMFYGASLFNNGQTGTQDISGNPFTGAFYTNSTKLLTSPNSKFRTDLSANDVLIITAAVSGSSPTLIYTSQINPPILSDVSLVLLTGTPSGEDISSNTIISIKKQVVGTAPLTWNTSNVTNIANIFYNATYFNQRVDTWDVSKVTDMTNAFQGFQSTSDYRIILSNVFNNGQLTGSGSSIDTSLNSWNTSNVTSMSYMFSLNSGFNQYISGWKTSNATNIAGMFYDAIAFNNGLAVGVAANDASLNGWDTSKVTSMKSLFQTAFAFNQNVSSWDVTKVTNMNTMFYLATSFNNGDTGNNGSNPLTGWSAPLCTDFSLMFQEASAFNQKVSNLVDTSNLTNPSGCTLASMFQSATLFNNGSAAGLSDASLNSWDTSKVTVMNGMFFQEPAFNQPIGMWNTSSVTTMASMFNNASVFNQNVSSWSVSNVTTMVSMFANTLVFNNGSLINDGSNNLNNWYAPSCTNFLSMFRSAASFNQAIPFLVDSSGIILDGSGNGVTLSNMFQSATTFNQNLNTWNTSSVTTMSSVFSTASVFNNGDASGASTQPLNWITDNVTTMSAMFVNALVFNQPIDTSGNYWNTGKVTNMFQMLAGGSVTLLFNQPIGRWDVSNCTTMEQMFYGANKFNQNISLWKTGNVTTMSQMFRAATLFNQTINTDASGSWNVSGVTDMSSMFSSALAFNNGGVALNWYAPNCITFASMFQSTTSFNQPIPILVDTSGNTDPSGCSLASMFSGATVFNQNVGAWNVSNVTDMTNVFRNTNNFNNAGSNSMNSWNVSNATNMTNMFNTAIAFNNGSASGVSTPGLTWSASKCISFECMFGRATIFNQQLPYLVNTSDVSSCSMYAMFNSLTGASTTLFNQNINSWNVSNVTTMNSMFFQATNFNNGSLTNDGANDLSWNASNCTNFTSMFQSATSFNQKVNNLVNTAGVIDCNLNSMFQAATIFNNGQIATMDISGNTSGNAFYATATKVLTSPGSQFRTQLLPSDVLIITRGTISAPSIVYTSQIQSSPILSDVSLVLLSGFGSDISSNPIITIKKQLTGNSTFDLSWNTTNVTTMANTFNNAYSFNQQLPFWNVSRVTTMASMFAGTSDSLKTIFNNGQLAGSSTQPLTDASFIPWSPPLCTTFASMFALTSGFNQPMENFINTSVNCSLNSMFASADVFNQNISNWNVSNVTTMNSTFNGATLFNNKSASGLSDASLNWYAPKCVDFGLMFRLTTAFNQSIPYLVDTSGVTVGTPVLLSGMFQSATIFNKNISNWNVSRVTQMNSMFSGSSTFNNGSASGLSDASLNWYAPNCITFASMFENAAAFNQPISNLVDTSGVTGCSLSSMFKNVSNTIGTLFNQNLNNWNVSRVISMSNMFSRSAASSAFNNGSASGLSDASLNWYAPNCTTFSQMFQGAQAFNQPIPNLVDTSGIIVGTTVTLASMFQSAAIFNQNISNWNVSMVTDMTGTFLFATAFNNGSPTNDISGNPLTWYAPNCRTFTTMFRSATSFNQPISTLVDTSGIIIDASGVGVSLLSMFSATSLFNQNINTWNTTNVTNMAQMFESSTAFNKNVSTNGTSWNVSNVTNMNAMFRIANAFNNGSLTNDISGNPLNWYAPKCTNFSLMFRSAIAFNQPISTLVDTSGVSLPTGCVMNEMFGYATVFNQDINSWNVSRVTNMSLMFASAVTPPTQFNNGAIGNVGGKPLTNWGAPICTNFSQMFQLAPFNQEILNLVDTSGVSLPTGCNLSLMFDRSGLFNQNLNNWNVSRVTNMSSMFSAVSFGTLFNNGGVDLSWNAPNCLNFSSMFQSSTAFNRAMPNLIDTSGIIVGTTVTLASMFQTATIFNQDISNWNLSRVTAMNLMFSGASAFNNGDPSGNTGTLLNAWSAPYCTNFTSMFATAPAFNQKLDNLVSLFPTTSNITGVNPATSSYTNSTKTLTCPGAVFTSALVNRILIIRMSSITYISNVQAFTNATNVVLTTAYGADIPSNSITSIYISKTLTSMFNPAIRFNQNLNNWSVSNVTAMNSMFSGATIYNNGGVDLTWNAPNCLNFASMFQSAPAFNRAVSNLVDTSGVTLGTTGTVSLASMFQSATLFNQNLNNWNVSRVTSMSLMFSGATVFNNGSLTNDGSNNLNNWNAPLCTTFASMFSSSTAFNQPIPFLVDTSNVTLLPTGSSLSSMFSATTKFNQNINSWNVSRVNNMSSMFSGATVFNNGSLTNDGSNNLNNWYAPLCTTFVSMFSSSTAFNQPLTNLVNTSSVATCTMDSMFLSASAFNNGGTGTVDISGTIASAVYTVATSILSYPGATFITLGLTTSDVLIITSGSAIIYTSQIQRIISETSLVLLNPYSANIAVGTITTIKKQVVGTLDMSWNTANVTTMASMFQNAYYFNQPISNWNVSKVTTMALMFAGASTALKHTFNNGQLAGSMTQPLNWTASRCTAFNSMFLNNAAFNQPVPTLVDVSGGNLTSMFQNASLFNQKVTPWKTVNVTTLASTFSGATMFNNGETLPPDISGNTLTAFYNFTTRLFTSPTAVFRRDLSINDVLIITTPAIVFSSRIISNIISDVSLNLDPSYNLTADISSNTITSIKKQVPGSPAFDLSWNTQNVTSVASVFQNATYFNQRLPWNTRKVGTVAATVTTLFAGPSTSLINLFNNGQIITGTTQPLYTTPAANTWDFSGNANVTVRGSACHANCRLTAGNGITFNPAIY